MTKKEIIIANAQKIIVQHGLFDASIGKIAKASQIPEGSIYTYFKSKEQMINEIYISIKQEMGAFIFQPLEDDLDVKDSLKEYWVRAVNFGLKNQEKFLFAEQFSNSPLITKLSQEDVEQQFILVFDLLKLGIENGEIKKMDLHILHHIIYTNIIGTIKFFSQADKNISHDIKDQLFQCCWDSISK